MIRRTGSHVPMARLSRTAHRAVATAIGGVLLWCSIVDLGARADWVVLEKCRLVLNPSNDGDSFHVSCGDKEYNIRLYLVDTPEIEGTDPRRLIEQAKYFEITVPQAIEVGETAKDFVREKLSEPFTVFTRMSDAMGRSKIERMYAFVQTKDGDLGEQLVRNGLARVYGTKVVPPGSNSSQSELAKLEQFEDEAKKERIGGWGLNNDRLRQAPGDKPNYTVFAKPGHSTAATSSAKPSPNSAPSKSMPDAAKKLDINIASKEQLEELPGVGPVLADEIIAARPFATADDLRNVKGIGGKRYEKLRPYFQP
jgi:DNA uptake protein ComE-like DNA-binding protein